MGEIKLEFTPRWYQKPLFIAMEEKGFKKALLCWSRRAGKDMTCWNFLIRQALRRTATYFYVWPTYAQAKKSFWDGKTIGGKPFLEFIPKELLKAKNSTEMKLTLTNNSIIQVAGSENYDSLRGSNPQGVIFSEYAYSDPNAFTILRPVLLANQGWCIVESTPNGENHFHKMFLAAQQSDDWYVSYLTVKDTKHISLKDIENDVEQGRMSRQMAEQEYLCSFTAVSKGAPYAELVRDMIKEERTENIIWDRNKKVYTSWDLGINDTEVIVFFQFKGDYIDIIDVEAGNNKGLAHYINILSKKPYNYGGHIAPHDINVREQSVSSELSGDALTRQNVASDLGIHFDIAPKLTIKEGIEAVRSMFHRLRINKDKGETLISALRNYQREYDAKNEVYKDKLIHNWASHYADCIRYLATGLHKISTDNTTPKELDDLYNEAMRENNYY